MPQISITARQVRVRLIATDLSGDRAPRVQLNFRTALAPYVDAEGPPIRDGRHAYTITVPCAQGCGMRGVTWDRPITARHRLSGTITLLGVDVRDRAGGWAPLNLHLQRPGAWQAAKPQGSATDQVTVTRTGIVDRFSNADGGYGGIGYAQPARIPAVATYAAVAGPGPPQRPDVVDALTATTADLNLRRLTRVLPAVLSDGVIADLRTLTNELPGFLAEAHWQVWLGSQAPGDALARLRGAGLRIGGVRTVPARVRQLGRQGPALALLLLLACAVAGAVLAVGGTAASIRAASRRRSYQIAALRTVGVKPRSLLGASVGEQLLLLGAAVLLGVPTGVSAARLAMPVNSRVRAAHPCCPQLCSRVGAATAIRRRVRRAAHRSPPSSPRTALVRISLPGPASRIGSIALARPHGNRWHSSRTLIGHVRAVRRMLTAFAPAE